METDWNKLIELYLSGELSVEGKEAFEKELYYNSDLQDELFTHRSIQQAAQRAHQRDLVLKASSNYYFQKKVNYIILSTLILLTAITLTYFLLKKSDFKRESTVELTLEKDQETPSSEESTQQASIGNEKSGNQELDIPEISSDNSMNYLNAEKNGSNLLTKTKNNTLSEWNYNTNSIISNFNDEPEKTTIVSIENLSQSERDLEKDESLDLVIANDKVAFSDTVIPVVGGGKVAESFSFTTTDDISTKSVLKKSTRSLMINSVIYVPEGSFLIVSEKKNDPVLVRNKFDNTDQIQEIGGMSFPKEKLVRKKDKEGNYYYCLPAGEFLFNQLLVVKEKSIDTLKSDDVISGVIEYQLITPTTEIKQVSKPFESAIGTNFSKSLKGKRRKQKVTDEKNIK